MFMATLVATMLDIATPLANDGPTPHRLPNIARIALQHLSRLGDVHRFFSTQNQRKHLHMANLLSQLLEKCTVF